MNEIKNVLSRMTTDAARRILYYGNLRTVQQKAVSAAAKLREDTASVTRKDKSDLSS